VDEVVGRQRRRPALGAELVEGGVQLAVGVTVGGPERLPAAAVGARQAGEGGRYLGVLDLGRVAGGDPGPGPAAGEQRREADDVVLDDEVGLQLVDDLAQALVDVASPVDERLEGRGDELGQLLGGRFAEDRGGVADEVLPELPRRFLGLRGGVSRISRSSNPCASSVPAKDSSTMKTTRWPRRRSTAPIPTQLLVGPNAPSGKKTIVDPFPCIDSSWTTARPAAM
jgi:hypothetical protein